MGRRAAKLRGLVAMALLLAIVSASHYSVFHLSLYGGEVDNSTPQDPGGAVSISAVSNGTCAIVGNLSDAAADGSVLVCVNWEGGVSCGRITLVPPRG